MDNHLPEKAWTPAYNADGEVRAGAWVAELTGMIDLSGWPPGMRVIVRKERPHPGAQLRFTDIDGLRLTAFATNTRRGQLPDLELRHRRRARCEDRIRAAKDTGLHNLPFHSFDANRIWCAIVELALDLTAWLQTLACTTSQHGAGNRKPFGCDCSRSPDASPTTPDEPACTCAETCTLDTATHHRPRTPHSHLTSINPHQQHRKDQHPGPWNPAVSPLRGPTPHTVLPPDRPQTGRSTQSNQHTTGEKF